MTPFRHSGDDAVSTAIELAAHDACAALTQVFPDIQRKSTPHHFKDHLADAMTEMLKGRSLFDRESDHDHLPTRLVDNEIFGQPNRLADGFLVARRDSGVLRAMDAVHGDFCPLSEIDVTWGTFDEAAEAARKYCHEQSLSLEAILAMGLSVLAVTRVSNGYRACPASPVTS